jgi:hypothetical protein
MILYLATPTSWQTNEKGRRLVMMLRSNILIQVMVSAFVSLMLMLFSRKVCSYMKMDVFWLGVSCRLVNSYQSMQHTTHKTVIFIVTTVRTSSHMCSHILFNYMFQNYHVELLWVANANGYWNMKLVTFKRECGYSLPAQQMLSSYFHKRAESNSCVKLLWIYITYRRYQKHYL